jgi:hypothetical protein
MGEMQALLAPSHPTTVLKRRTMRTILLRTRLNAKTHAAKP